jgi:hypothetical protein
VIVLDVDTSEVFTGQATTLHLALREQSREEPRPTTASARSEDSALARVRRAINGYGSVICSACHRSVPPSEIEVDHRVALAAGGANCDANVLLVCSACHDEVSESGHRRS